MLTPAQIATLSTMLTYCRPHGSRTEAQFTARYLATLPGISQDVFGNWHCKIGESPILWTSHTDTVHKMEGMQSVRTNPETGEIRLSRRSKRTRNCLGADDTVGVFLMREMILAGTPGHYIFHYGEEVGGIGSGSLASKTPDVLGAHLLYAIALDRAGTGDVITHQSFGRCCSDAFAVSLARQLPGTYAPDDSGVYTDTAEYTHLIPECTNLSVGYYAQHSSREYVDYLHVGRLLPALIALDSSALVCKRDPFAVEEKTDWYKYQWYRKPDPLSSSRVDVDGDIWCLDCDAPVFDDDDPRAYLEIDRCVCGESVIPSHKDEYDPYEGLSEDDAQFLRYLRER